jgi:hypothetical protein
MLPSGIYGIQTCANRQSWAWYARIGDSRVTILIYIALRITGLMESDVFGVPLLIALID